MNTIVVRAIRIMALASLWLVPLIILTAAFTWDWVSVWEKVRLEEWSGSFMDLRVISSGVETQQRGGDPLVSNPADEFHRPIPYPRIWVHLFSWLGIDDSKVPIVGVTFCVLYLICISWLIIQSPGALGPLVLLIAGLSLAPLLAIERGNIDLFIFALIFLGCAAAGRFLKIGTYFVATALKIYPIAALLVEAVRRPLKAAFLPIAATLSAVALFAWQWRDLKAISHTAPITTFLSFGTLALVAQARAVSWFLVACSLAVAASILSLAWVTRPKFDDGILNSPFGEMFLVFGGIYVFAFTVGSNYNYRLIFLIPTLPLVLELAWSKRHSRWAFIYIAVVIAAENSFFLGVYQGIPLGSLSTWTIFAMLLPILHGQLRNFFRSPQVCSRPQILRLQATKSCDE
jgi:hypothetical protein